MRFTLSFLLLIPLLASAQVYKWTDENGNVHFGSQPPAGQREEVRIRESSPGAMGAENGTTSLEQRAADLEREAAQRRYSSGSSSRSTDLVERPDYVCQGAKNRLKSAEERWERIRRQGYRQSEKDYYEQRIRDLKRHKDNICR